MIFRKKPQILFSPMLGTFGGASIQGFKGGGAAIDYQLDTSGGAYWNNYNANPNAKRDNTTNVNIDGIANIVLNGYGILFYGWASQNSGSLLRSITLPDILLGAHVDIEFVGTGGPSRGGGSGGTGGGCGGRLVHEVKNLSYGIKTGASNYNTQNSVGSEAECNLELLETGRSGALCSAQHNNMNGGSHYGVVRNNTSDGSYPIYRTQGFSKNGYGAVDQSYVNTWTTLIAQRDNSYATEASRGGAGKGLNGYATSAYSTGYGLGGGGGGQNQSMYGGSAAGASGGRYGYDGGAEYQDGLGPPSVSGVGSINSTYSKGGGGCFGGGSGDAGNNSLAAGSGGGAILMRWDTTEAYAAVGFQSGRQGWP